MRINNKKRSLYTLAGITALGLAALSCGSDNGGSHQQTETFSRKDVQAIDTYAVVADKTENFYDIGSDVRFENVDGEERLVVVDRELDNIINLTRNIDSDEMNPSISKDGDYVVWQTDSRDSLGGSIPDHDIRVWDSQDNISHRIIPYGAETHDINPVVSNSGKVAFQTVIGGTNTDPEYSVFVVDMNSDVDAGSEDIAGKKLTYFSFDGSNLMKGENPAISGNGKFLTFDSEGDVYRVSLTDNEMMKVSGTSAFEGFSSVSNDGDVAFTSNRDGRNQVYLAYADGTLENLTEDFHGKNFAYPSLSTSGYNAAFVEQELAGNNLFGSKIWEMNIYEPGSAWGIVEIASGQRYNMFPSISSNRDYLAFVAGDVGEDGMSEYNVLVKHRNPEDGSDLLTKVTDYHGRYGKPVLSDNHSLVFGSDIGQSDVYFVPDLRKIINGGYDIQAMTTTSSIVPYTTTTSILGTSTTTTVEDSSTTTTSVDPSTTTTVENSTTSSSSTTTSAGQTIPQF